MKFEFCPDRFRIGFLLGFAPTFIAVLPFLNPVFFFYYGMTSTAILRPSFGTWQFAVLVPAIIVFSATRRPMIVKGLCAAGIFSVFLNLWLRVGLWVQS